MWAIWDFGEKTWVREMPSKVDDGGEAILIFFTKMCAANRAAKHFGFDDYCKAEQAGWCKVIKIGDVPADAKQSRRI